MPEGFGVGGVLAILEDSASYPRHPQRPSTEPLCFDSVAAAAASPNPQPHRTLPMVDQFQATPSASSPSGVQRDDRTSRIAHPNHSVIEDPKEDCLILIFFAHGSGIYLHEDAMQNSSIALLQQHGIISSAIKWIYDLLPWRFREPINGLAYARWSLIASAGVDNVCIFVNPSLSKVINCHATFNNGLPLVSIYEKAFKLLHSYKFGGKIDNIAVGRMMEEIGQDSTGRRTE